MTMTSSKILLVTRNLRNSRLSMQLPSIKLMDRIERRRMMILRDGLTRWSCSHLRSVEDWRRVFSL
jgi:hypothetical protein